MQIVELRIMDYKCLVDFKIDFQINGDGSSTILIGQNGSGKSTMLESILRILASFHSPYIGRERQFDFYIKYSYAGEMIEISRNGQQYQIKNLISGKGLSGSLLSVRRKLNKEQMRILPKRIILFYSGEQDKLKPLYNAVATNYYYACRRTLIDYFNYATGTNVEGRKEFFFPDKQYNYCSDDLTAIFLTSILLDKNNSAEKDILKAECSFDFVKNIEVELSLRKFRSIIEFENMKDITNEFFVLLAFIEPELEPIFRIGYRHKESDKLYFTLESLEKVALDKIAIFNVFEKIQTLFGAKMEVTVQKNADNIRVSDMSEGQRQLIRILGMLGLYKNEDCLVLMDEPDSHMNPRWKYNLKSTIDKCLKYATNTQALIATHDPLVLNGVDKECIRIFETQNLDGCNIAKVYVPTDETKGLGIDGLLQSQYYGLKTSYDKDTAEKYERRSMLYSKLVRGQASEPEKNELKALSEKLGGLPFSNNCIDFLYDDFIGEYRSSELYYKDYLSVDEVEQRKQQIQMILENLFKEK